MKTINLGSVKSPSMGKDIKADDFKRASVKRKEKAEAYGKNKTPKQIREDYAKGDTDG